MSDHSAQTELGPYTVTIHCPAALKSSWVHSVQPKLSELIGEAPNPPRPQGSVFATK